MSSAWREDMLTRAKELPGLQAWIVAHDDHGERTPDLHSAIEKHLLVVGHTAAGTGEGRIKRMWHTLNGTSRAHVGNLDAAEVHLLRLAPSSVLIPALPSVQANVNHYLPKGDPRRGAVDRIARHRTERILIARTATGSDVWLVELLGLLGAALTGAAALRSLGSNSTPYAATRAVPPGAGWSPRRRGAGRRSCRQPRRPRSSRAGRRRTRTRPA